MVQEGSRSLDPQQRSSQRVRFAEAENFIPDAPEVRYSQLIRFCFTVFSGGRIEEAPSLLSSGEREVDLRRLGGGEAPRRQGPGVHAELFRPRRFHVSLSPTYRNPFRIQARSPSIDRWMPPEERL